MANNGGVMLAAMGYGIGGLAMACAIGLSKDPLSDAAGGEEVFRYQMSKAWSSFFVGAFALFLFVAWLLAGVSLSNASGIACYVSGWIMLFAIAGGYFYCKAYRVTATDDGLWERGLFTDRTIPYRDIKEVVLKEGGGRGGSLLQLYDSRGKRIYAVGSSFDQQGLSALVRTRCAKYGIRYRQRDMWGKWS